MKREQLFQYVFSAKMVLLQPEESSYSGDRTVLEDSIVQIRLASL